MTLEEARQQFSAVNIPDDATEIRFYVKKHDLFENGARYLEEVPILEYKHNDKYVLIQVGNKRKMRKM